MPAAAAPEQGAAARAFAAPASAEGCALEAERGAAVKALATVEALVQGADHAVARGARAELDRLLGDKGRDPAERTGTVPARLAGMSESERAAACAMVNEESV